MFWMLDAARLCKNELILSDFWGFLHKIIKKNFIIPTIDLTTSGLKIQYAASRNPSPTGQDSQWAVLLFEGNLTMPSLMKHHDSQKENYRVRNTWNISDNFSVVCGCSSPELFLKMFTVKWNGNCCTCDNSGQYFCTVLPDLQILRSMFEIAFFFYKCCQHSQENSIWLTLRDGP